ATSRREPGDHPSRQSGASTPPRGDPGRAARAAPAPELRRSGAARAGGGRSV
ncbi:MAG: hypothetical protein AVDCRST_MAG11-2295, partial [uncultured Gemmatimonadaceae bacterium]